MIQRIQTIFFLVAALCLLGLLFVPFWQYSAGGDTQLLNAQSVQNHSSQQEMTQMSFTEDPLHTGFFALTLFIPLLLLIIIFLYKNRSRQIGLGYVALILTLITIVVMVFFSRQGPYDTTITGEGSVQLGLALPMVAVVLIWLGIKRVQADEDLVKSVDRIR